jgi:thioredoxin reductase
MMETVTKTDVIIVGAGPTGLSLAVQLIRYDIDFVIFDLSPRKFPITVSKPTSMGLSGTFDMKKVSCILRTLVLRATAMT